MSPRAGRQIHDLKIWPIYYSMIRSGVKKFEVRKNDRGFRVGDALVLREFNPNTRRYTGRSSIRFVSYILHGREGRAAGFGVHRGWVVMSLARP